MDSKKTVILGIDPGTQITGYGIIKAELNEISPLDFGCIRPPSKMPLFSRYRILFEGIQTLIERYNPTILVVESQFVLKNAQSALKLGMAKAMATLAAALKDLLIHEYTPTQAKLAIVGHGHASKEQMQKMIQSLLRLSSLPKPFDAADALALALCHTYRMRSPLCLSPSLDCLKKNTRRKQSSSAMVSPIGSQSP